MSSFNRSTLAALAVCGCLSFATRAAVVAHDDFNYTPGAALSGNAGGTGWNAAWTNPGGVTGVSVVSTPTPITYGTLSGGPTAVQIDTGTSSALSGARSFAAQTGELWFSVLLRTPAAIGSDDFLQLALNNDTDQNNSASIGDTNTSATGGDVFSVRIGSANGGTTQSGTTTIQPNTDYLLVGRVSKDAPTSATNYDRVEMWVNPNLLLAAPDGLIKLADADSGMTQVTHFTFRGANLASGSPYLIDEVRVGTTYADVITVPEPAAAGVITGAAALLAGRRTQRRRRA